MRLGKTKILDGNGKESLLIENGKVKAEHIDVNSIAANDAFVNTLKGKKALFNDIDISVRGNANICGFVFGGEREGPNLIGPERMKYENADGDKIHFSPTYYSGVDNGGTYNILTYLRRRRSNNLDKALYVDGNMGVDGNIDIRGGTINIDPGMRFNIPTVLFAGRVSAGMRFDGCQLGRLAQALSLGRTPYREKGWYRITHSLGHENYKTMVSPYGFIANEGERGICNAIVMSETSTYIDVLVADSSNGDWVEGSFNIEIVGL